MTEWVTADTHYGHRNIINHCNRPFNNSWEMDKQLIANHNATVSKNDNIYFLGDFSWRSKGRTIEILKQLNGKKYLICGNHEQPMIKQTETGPVLRPEVQPYIGWVKQYHELTIQDKSIPRGKQMIFMIHYAMKVWNQSHRGSWCLYGHSHNGLPDDPDAFSMDVGVDAIAQRYAVDGVLNPEDYRPICYEEIKIIMENKKCFQP